MAPYLDHSLIRSPGELISCSVHINSFHFVLCQECIMRHIKVIVILIRTLDNA